MSPKHRNLLWLVLAILGGAVLGQVVVTSEREIFVSWGASALVAIVFCFRWYRLDAAERGFPRTLLLDVGVLTSALLVVPLYLFRSRGASAGLRATALFLLAVVGLVVLDLAVRRGVFLWQISIETPT